MGATVKLTDRTVTALLAAFKSPDPTPGGGSAAALAGAVGAALLAMVASLPRPRAETEKDVARLTAAGGQCAALSAELEALVDRDSDAYHLVMVAYRQPKVTGEEKAARSAAIQAALRGATAAPVAVMRACAAAAEQGVVIAAGGNPSASSDLQVGFELLGAAARGAKLNVEMNLGSVKDPEYVGKTRGEVAGLESAIGHQAEAARLALAR